MFIDLRKAFDTVDHAVLLDKLSNLGILDKEHGWFTVCGAVAGKVVNKTLKPSKTGLLG